MYTSPNTPILLTPSPAAHHPGQTGMLPVYAGGGRAVFLMLVLTATGILEVFHYIPTPDQAAQSIQTLTFLWINCKAG